MCAGVQGDRDNLGELFGMLNLLDTGARHKVSLTFRGLVQSQGWG